MLELFRLLHFSVLPQITPFDFGDELINSGDSASLTCSIHKGDIPFEITWLHDNVTVANTDGIAVSRVNKKISTLSIDFVQAEHSGAYTCLAKNSAGTASYTAHLYVNGTNNVSIYVIVANKREWNRRFLQNFSKTQRVYQMNQPLVSFRLLKF